MLRLKDDLKPFLHELIWFDVYYIKHYNYLCIEYFFVAWFRRVISYINMFGFVSLNLVVHMTKMKKDLCVTRSGKWTWITWRGIPVSNNKILLRNKQSSRLSKGTSLNISFFTNWRFKIMKMNGPFSKMLETPVLHYCSMCKWPKEPKAILARDLTQCTILHYRSGTINSNTVNSKFHLIRSFFEILATILSFHV